MGFLDEWAGNWKRALNSASSIGDDLKNYIDKEDYNFHDLICFTIEVKDVNSAGTSLEDLTISTIGNKINSYTNPPATNKTDYEYVRNLFYSKKEDYINYLSSKFNLDSQKIRQKLNGWQYGTGISALFNKYFSSNHAALMIIKRMQINKYHNERSYCDDFREFASDIKKDSNNNAIW